MSISFRLTTKCSSIATFHKLLDVVAKRHRACVVHEKDTSEFTLCRFGTIFFDYEETDDEVLVAGDCQTNLLGAGFHKAAIELMDEVVDLNGYPFEVEDDTEYYEHRDFEEMRSVHFYPWLSKVMNHCHERMGSDCNMLAVCWDYAKYIPQEVEGTVISPFGRINLQRFIEREERLGIEAVAPEFFMWNNEERDAVFYRNSALSALWEDCYFMPSSRSDEDKEINAFILENLEKAAAMDASLPFPKEDYLLVCRLAEKEPIDVSALPDYVSDYPIGYRKGEVTYGLGNLSFQLPGNFISFEQENSFQYYDTNDAEAWHLVHTTAFTIGKGEINYLEEDGQVLVEERDFENGTCRLYYLGAEFHGDAEDIYQCQVLTEHQFSAFTISCDGKEESARFSADFIRHFTATKEEEDSDAPAEENAADYNPEMYEEEELDALEEHIDKYFGLSDQVFHEIASPDIHVDIYIIEPTPERNYYTLVTTGMGAHRMNVPDELDEYKLKRAEMLIYLPADWNIQSQEEEDYWPLRWLKILARLPIEQDTWLGWGHTVPNGAPLAGNTQLSGVMLIDPENVEGEAGVCELPNGEHVNFYQVIPLYEEEMNYKIEHGAEALLEKMDDVSALVDINRRNVCAD